MDIRIKKIKTGYQLETVSSTRTFKYITDLSDAVFDLLDQEIESEAIIDTSFDGQDEDVSKMRAIMSPDY